MSCSFCQNPDHNIRNCNSLQIQNICNRIKVFVTEAISGNDYNESTFMYRIRSFRLRELKVACIHWKYFCDPELLTDFNIPEIRATLNYNTYIYIVIWLYIYMEHRYNESFLQHSRNRMTAYKGFWIMQRRKFWRNLGLLNMDHIHARSLYINALDEYQTRHNLYSRDELSGQPLPPRKFEFDINVCSADVIIAAEVDDECPICYDELKNETSIRNQCGHSICVGCFEKYMDTMIPKTSDPCCSICRSVFKKIDIYSDTILSSIVKYT